MATICRPFFLGVEGPRVKEQRHLPFMCFVRMTGGDEEEDFLNRTNPHPKDEAGGRLPYLAHTRVLLPILKVRFDVEFCFLLERGSSFCVGSVSFTEGLSAAGSRGSLAQTGARHTPWSPPVPRPPLPLGTHYSWVCFFPIRELEGK